MNSRWLNLKKFFAISVLGPWLAVALCLPTMARAQEVCTTNNWSSVVGDTELSVGLAGADNRKYSGPCGLRVNLAGTDSYVQDDSPLNESIFNVRFYFYFNDVTEEVVMYQALDGSGVPVIEAYYDPAGAIPGIYVDFSNGVATESVPATGLGTGWHSLEIQWSATGNPNVRLQQGDTSTSQTWSNPLDMSGVTVESARLGAIGTVPTSGSIDFDDYDSRREGTPGRLVVGDANGDDGVNAQDFVQVINEILGSDVGEGQSDCTEDGGINAQDFVCVINIILGTSG